MDNYIEFKNVKKQYQMGEVTINALDGVDFSIKKGEFVIIVGASGAGKSTILNILGGMDTLTSGEIIVDGKKISSYSNKELITYRRNDVGFVFQFYNLVQNLTASENLELATQISKNPLNNDEVDIDDEILIKNGENDEAIIKISGITKIIPLIMLICLKNIMRMFFQKKLNIMKP